MLEFGYCLIVSWLFCFLLRHQCLTGFHTKDEPDILVVLDLMSRSSRLCKISRFSKLTELEVSVSKQTGGKNLAVAPAVADLELVKEELRH